MSIWITGGLPTLIAGPCQIEDLAHAEAVAQELISITRRQNFRLIYKSSFEKANRTSVGTPSGPGMATGLKTLSDLKERTQLEIITDVHETTDVNPAAKVVDFLQIPAMLSRQTPLIRACAETGLPVNLKKSQTMSPGAALRAIEKLRFYGCSAPLLTERGTQFGYGDLIVDYRQLLELSSQNVEVCFDGTHSVQLPSSSSVSGGQPQFTAGLCVAAASIGVSVFFLETHEDPGRAPSDGATMVPLDKLEPLLARIRSTMESVRPDRDA